ncbi:hypothetical protein Sa4125_04510 [Aureimonas sp. SA4125]|uniref:DUF2235 domain-containing protein n=1 Tax=Aureimonas sp. SA4125 TaxID=2826993 RepID=UPI001CC5214D|nr:DUF2235 domain-containing protein [Aureimonas sp. SA4125]BDA82909.1 hypothetical protein Sa4125_04510 [Aureimonas sp. SA4125]
MAQLVVCCDGTWNTPGDKEDGLPAPTNVVKLYNSLAPVDAAGAEQKRYYHPGVGTDGDWWNRLLGGGIGRGLNRNIASAYRWLAGAYRPGDAIWLFGFSRGAYTARSVGGMISRCGLLDTGDPEALDPEVWKQVDALFQAYRAKTTLPATAERRFHNVAGEESPFHSTPIHFIGAFDTVGALGIPADLALLHLIDDPTQHQFHDTELSPIVRHARHAVGIDERRQSFTPTLWTNRLVEPGAPDMRQLWFPGVHGDVGGGYGQAGLSDIALDWMMGEAEAQGLAIKPGARSQLRPSPQALMHDSLTGIFAQLKTRPRAVPRISGGDGETQFLHASVVARHDTPPIAQGDYWPVKTVAAGAPVSIAVFARQHWNACNVFLEAGTEYVFSAEGQWLDGAIACGPAGTKDGRFQVGEVAHLAGSLIDASENLFKRLSGNRQADFWMSRRKPEFPWFALVGLVANGVRSTDDPRAPEHEVFLIGDAARFTPQAGGYLYAFANDAWHAYGDNAGSVRLTVRRA